MWIAQVLLYLVHYVEEKIETFAPSLSFIYTVVHVQIIWSFFDTDGQLFTRGVWWAIFLSIPYKFVSTMTCLNLFTLWRIFPATFGEFSFSKFGGFFCLILCIFQIFSDIKRVQYRTGKALKGQIFSVQDLKRSEFWAPLATLIVSCLEADIAGKPIEARHRTNVAGGGGGGGEGRVG